MTQQGWIIRNAFIVLVAERPINTDMLNPEILRESGITPAQWELVEPTEGRAGTFIAYRNGITISAQNTRCVFQQNFNDETVGDPADGIYDVARLCTESPACTKSPDSAQKGGRGFRHTPTPFLAEL